MEQKKKEDTSTRSQTEKSKDSKNEHFTPDNATEEMHQEQQLKSRLMKRPILPIYENMPSPSIQNSNPAIGQTCEENSDSMPGFSELRKFKRVNETRVITPYRRETHKKRDSSSIKTIVPKIKIEDPKKFFLDKGCEIPITNLQSLVQMARNEPDIGYVTMKREHMDLLNDYNPYSFTICNYDNVDKSNYVTISPNGLVEFYKDDADFLPLDRLQSEQKLLCALKEIPSFQVFRLWKAFMVWFKKARCKRFIEAREKIEMFFAAKYSSRAITL